MLRNIDLSPSESSMNSSLKLGSGSTSTRQNYAGKHPYLQNHMPTQGPGGGLLSQNQRTAVPQVSWVSSGQGVTDLPFPKRLGVEFNGRDSPQSAERQISLQTTSAVKHVSIQIMLFDLLLANLKWFSFLTILEDKLLQLLLMTISQEKCSGPTFRRPLGSTPEDVTSNNYSSFNANLIPHKTSCFCNSQSCSSFHTNLPITITDSTTPRVPVTAAPSPTVSHITWKDPETSPPELTKYKCLLCKRDLSLTSEGAVYQPTAPPAVAVLPCGHTFHDQCLQKITPQDQAKDPPCIPCAIDEN
uniref:RING-type domain-containing protein n=1 Tax=Lactuca sativa TaxID=4236 RepID=A0A9R1VZB1_LACSA|nr:hypothetical protein LSAT_V11C400216000 [Lactuca sativa]